MKDSHVLPQGKHLILGERSSRDTDTKSMMEKCSWTPGSMTEPVPSLDFQGHLLINLIFVYISLSCNSCHLLLKKKSTMNTKISIYPMTKFGLNPWHIDFGAKGTRMGCLPFLLIRDPSLRYDNICFYYSPPIVFMNLFKVMQ